MYVREMRVLAAAQLRDTWGGWISLSSDNSMEWYGYNNKLAREKSRVYLIMPATVYLFNPLIDAPPSHPDTVLTSLLYMDTSLDELLICALACSSTWLDKRWSGGSRTDSRMLSLGQEQCTLSCPSSDVSVHWWRGPAQIHLLDLHSVA